MSLFGAIGGALIGAAGSILGGRESSRGAERASDAQVRSTEMAIDFQREALEEQRELLQPFVDMGTGNINRLLAGIGGVDAYGRLKADPYGYDYLTNNPMFDAAIDNAARQTKAFAAGTGKLGSGGLVNELFQNYLATGDQYYGNYLNRLDTAKMNNLNFEALPVTIGQQSAANQAANLAGFGANAGNAAMMGGNALAAGIMGQANARANTINSLVGIGNNLMGYGINNGWFGGGGMAGSPVTYGGTTYQDSTHVPLVGPQVIG